MFYKEFGIRGISTCFSLGFLEEDFKWGFVFKLFVKEVFLGEIGKGVGYVG